MSEQRRMLEFRLDAIDREMKEVNERIPKVFPVGTRVEITRPMNKLGAVKERVKGTVVGYVHHWRLDLRIKIDGGGNVTKVVSKLSLPEITILP